MKRYKQLLICFGKLLLCFGNILMKFSFSSRYLAEKVSREEGFRLIKEPMCTNVCFYYIPPSLRGQEETPEWWQKVGKVSIEGSVRT